MLHCYKYRLPFKSPFGSAGHTFTHREGLILVYRDGDIEAYGEVAPLPGFSSESLEQVMEVLKINHAFLQRSLEAGEGQSASQLLDQIHQFPSLSFGMDTLIHDLKAKKQGISLGDLLFDMFPPTVSANATLPLGETTEETIAHAKQLTEKGFKTLKVKVGWDFNYEFKLLQEIRKQFPDITLRIDANQAWDKDVAIQNLNALTPLDMEYCEQPVSKKDPEDLVAVRNEVAIPIAADESVRNKEEAIKLSELKAADLFVVKPMLFGTFNNIFVTKQVSDTHNIEMVFTTALETAVGRTVIAVLAAGLGAEKRAHGLATGGLLQKDVSLDQWMNEAEVKFQNSPGLGIKLDLEGLKKLF